MTSTKKVYCIDLDNTICNTINKSYATATPYIEVINKINELYDEGNTIKIYTARGGTSKIDYHDLTLSQLKDWNVKYHELIDKNKPHFDILIDDKAINAFTWMRQNNIQINTIPMNITDYINLYLYEVQDIADKIDKTQIELFIKHLQDCKSRNGRLFVIGVGGSAANASHAVNDFRKIANIETYSVSENVAELTARINDNGWNTSYSDWLKTSKLNENDVILVFSVGGGSSTTSQNIVEAMTFAKSINSKILSVVSRDGGVAKLLSDACVLIPVIHSARITPHAEEWQGIILHLVVNAL
jgi:D-sedoheptulose 7-phosphate isomerase